MQKLMIHIYNPGKSEPASKITIPLSVLHISERLLPIRAKTSLKNEGIDLSELNKLLTKHGPKGTLIEVENENEKLVVIVE